MQNAIAHYFECSLQIAQVLLGKTGGHSQVRADLCTFTRQVQDTIIACRGNLRKCIVNLNSYYVQTALKAAEISNFLDTHERQDH